MEGKGWGVCSRLPVYSFGCALRTYGEDRGRGKGQGMDGWMDGRDTSKRKEARKGKERKGKGKGAVGIG